MLKPVTVSSAAAIAKWNQSIPKYHRYNGTAVRVRKNVPIRNELVIQLIRSVGIRKIKERKIWGTLAGSRNRPAENNVLLCPVMNAAAMRAGELLRFYFGRLPAVFVNRAAGVGQF